MKIFLKLYHKPNQTRTELRLRKDVCKLRWSLAFAITSRYLW